ncbi:MAG: phosphoribosylglycinamide formyltransferase [Chitinophagaceae bacterium]|nr:phosphoribosylglycinamide formyltransferase [Chitinophagaceae bacterium]
MLIDQNLSPILTYSYRSCIDQYICPVKKIAVFASGTGSNAAKIMERFRNHPSIQVALLVCNNPGAGVLKIAAKENIPSLLIEKEKFFRGNGYLPDLKETGIDFIVLAGFLWKIPATVISAFPQKIINIHPALLPAYGGKGMYGHHVHEAVIANKEIKSGITIHYVDDQYDHGKIIFQATCPVLEKDTAGSLALRIAALEHTHYPAVIEQVISGTTPL